MMVKAKATKTLTKAEAIKARREIPLPSAVLGLLNRKQVCQALGEISIRKLSGMISTGVFPRADKRVGQSPRWSIVLVNQWVAELGTGGDVFDTED